VCAPGLVAQGRCPIDGPVRITAELATIRPEVNPLDNGNLRPQRPRRMSRWGGSRDSRDLARERRQQLELQLKLRGVGKDYPGLQVALALIAEHDGLSRCVGSAFAVAPGLAITASHVIDECVNFQEKRDGYKRHDPVISLTAVQSYDEKVFVWSVDAIYRSVSSDIAFLRFRRPNWWGDATGQVKPRCALLNLNPPAIGDNVRIFGFPDSALREGVLSISPAECVCRVQKVDLRTAQPSWYKPLSHIELEGEMEHGMSGGPCFDKDWNVIGVNSLGWSGFPSAKVGLLWPAMKVEIDLFKTGSFTVIDLFSGGTALALGYLRVYVTSTREVRFARVDPDSLVPLGHFGMTEHLSGAIDLAASGAQEALAELKESLAKAQSGAEKLDSNQIIRLARHYFWELETALRLALLLAARQANLSIPEPPSWEQVMQAWRAQTAEGVVLDDIAMLDFDWNSIDLFELRTYADLSRSGVLALQCVTGSNPNNPGPIIACSLEPQCRKGGQQLFLPDGLDRFMDAGRRFVQKLLRLSGAPK